MHCAHAHCLQFERSDPATPMHPDMRGVSWGQSAQTTTKEVSFAILQTVTQSTPHRECSTTPKWRSNVKDAPVLESVKVLQVFLYEKFKTELEPATCPESFRLGYITGTNCGISISSSTQLAEAYSSAKRGFVTFWADTDVQKKSGVSATAKKRKNSTPLECENDEGIQVLSVPLSY